MTRDDIITAASKAGFETWRDMIWVDTWEITPTLARFAALVRAGARGVCEGGRALPQRLGYGGDYPRKGAGDGA